MVQAVGENGIATSYQCRHDADIGHVTGAVKEGAIGPDKTGQCLFQRIMRSHMAADHMRTTRTGSPLPGRCTNSIGQCRMGRQPQIVVTAKSENRPAIDDSLRTAGGLQRFPLTQQIVFRQRLKLPGQFFPDHFVFPRPVMSPSG